MSADRIPPGTLCYLVHVAGTASSFGGKMSIGDVNGRVVTVIAGPRDEWNHDLPGPWYDIRAPWLEERFPGRWPMVIRKQLVPISGKPEDAAAAQREEARA